MRWLPWARPETRAAGGFTDSVTAALIAAAEGTGTAETLAATEQASGLIGRAFASADVEGDDYGLVSALALEMIGREFTRSGESLHVIEVRGGRGRLIPASSWDIVGGDDPLTWSYRATLGGPTTLRSFIVPATSVIHCRANVDPRAPWRGRSPLAIASSTANTAASAEGAANEEMKIKPTRLQPVPGSPKQTEALAKLLADGGLVVTQSAQSDVAHIAGMEPSGRWAAQLIHPDLTLGHVNVRSEAAMAILSACGVPPALVDSRTDGTSQRESFRRFLHSTVQPLARLAESELRVKLDAPDLSLSFDSLFAADLSGRARAFQSLVGGGMAVTEAAALSGLMESEAD